jgi:chemotaxis methyl-accepting protein methylase
VKQPASWNLLRDRFRAWTGNRLSVTSSASAMETLERLASRHGMKPERYIDFLDTRGESERQVLIDHLLVRTTWFLREPDAIFGLVAAFKRRPPTGRGRLSVWSVACSSGEEPYTLAMALIDAGFDPTILATDLSEEARELAAAAEYPGEKVADLPHRWQQRYFVRAEGGRVRVAPLVRSAVSFVEHNLSVSARPPQGWASFDAVVCRNVLLYFERPEAIRILRELSDCCREDGYLLLSAAEHPIAWSVGALVWERTDDVPLLRRRRPADGPAPELPPGVRSTTPAPMLTGVPLQAGSPSGTPRPSLPKASPATTAELVKANGAARRGDSNTALSLLRGIIDRDPGCAPAHLALGLVQKGLGHIPEAMSALRRARYLFGDESWLAPYTLAVCLEIRCDWREALEAYRHAAEILEWGGPSGLAVSEGNEEMLGSTVLESCHQRIESLRRL